MHKANKKEKKENSVSRGRELYKRSGTRGLLNHAEVF